MSHPAITRIDLARALIDRAAAALDRKSPPNIASAIDDLDTARANLVAAAVLVQTDPRLKD
jgi:hypothetical protein